MDLSSSLSLPPRGPPVKVTKTAHPLLGAVQRVAIVSPFASLTLNANHPNSQSNLLIDTKIREFVKRVLLLHQTGLSRISKLYNKIGGTIN